MSGVIAFILLTFLCTVLHACAIAWMIFGEFDKLNERLDRIEKKKD